MHNRNRYPYYFMDIRGTKIQLYEVIEALGLNDHHHVAAAVEYLARWHNKNGVEDLRKAKWRIERAIEAIERAQNKETTDAKITPPQSNPICLDEEPTEIFCEACGVRQSITRDTCVKCDAEFLGRSL